MKKLNLPANPSPADLQRLMQSPEYQEMLRFADDAQNTPEAKAEERYQQAKQRYDGTTKVWLQKSGYSTIRAWRGKAVALLESPDPQAVAVQFTTAKRFFDTNSGRLCWSGGCVLTGAKNGYPERRSERKDPATVQLFIGQEGYFLKYAGAGTGENRDKLYQPFVTGHLFKMRRTNDFPAMMGEPGDDGIFGLPFAGAGKVLRGKLRITLEDSAVYSIGWELTPV